MIKNLLLISLILTGTTVFAFDNYVSPETYAVNEADLTDYRYVQPSPKLNIDALDMPENISETVDDTVTDSIKTTSKKGHKEKVSKDDDSEAYKRKLSYKFAKWWVDKRYEREEPHHGTKHEIKVQARMDYEKSLENIQESE